MDDLQPEDYLTSKRFDKKYSEASIIIAKLKNDNTLNQESIKQIEEEDLLLKIKLNTYEKSKKKIIISCFILVLSILLFNTSPIFSVGIISGFIVFVSSFFGIQTNKISPKQKDYLKS